MVISEIELNRRVIQSDGVVRCARIIINKLTDLFKLPLIVNSCNFNVVMCRIIDGSIGFSRCFQSLPSDFGGDCQGLCRERRVLCDDSLNSEDLKRQVDEVFRLLHLECYRSLFVGCGCDG